MGATNGQKLVARRRQPRVGQTNKTERGAAEKQKTEGTGTQPDSQTELDKWTDGQAGVKQTSIDRKNVYV